MSIAKRFQPRLEERQQAHLYRHRPLALSAQQPSMQINGIETVNFSANDYLGIANHPQLKTALKTALDQPSQHNSTVSYGAGAAHLVTGHHLQHHLLEDELADWLRVERCLLFSTGYMANLAILQTLMQAGDVIIADKLNHASLVDGALASPAELKRYPHGDMQALEKRLLSAQQANQQAIIVSDGVFSMDGDLAPLETLQDLAQRYQAWLFIDDAHGFGVLGDNGGGCFAHFELTPDDNTIIVGTLGKAFGTSGAFVAGSETLIETLIQFARPYIYTTATPQLNALLSRQALRIICSPSGQALRETLQHHIELFTQLTEQAGFTLLSSQTPIQPLIIGDSQQALQWSDHLKQLGFWVSAIRPPTVPKNSARLRITLSAAHTKQQIKALVSALQQCQTALAKSE